MASLPFLSPYLADLDSTNGDIDIKLLLNGQANDMKRNGFINIKDGSIYTLLVSDPITRINGNAKMVDNKLIINRLEALLHNASGNSTKQERQNTYIDGTMDFSKFFHPGYDLKVKSNNASYLSLIHI